VRIVIADDHFHYRRGLTRMLRASGIDVVAAVPDGEAAVRAVEVTEPDAVLMDLYMPGVSGVEATRLIARRGTPVVLITVFADESEIVDAMVAGASGSVLKDRPIEELIAALHAAAAGSPVVTPGIASALLQRFRDRTRGDMGPPLPA
jgi:DNA-binding NarL/FixJ family response regulator